MENWTKPLRGGGEGAPIDVFCNLRVVAFSSIFPLTVSLTGVVQRVLSRMRPTLMLLSQRLTRIQDKTCTISSILGSPLGFLPSLDHFIRPR